MIAVRSRKIEEFRSVFREDSILGEVSSVSTSSENDRTVALVLLSSVFVFDSDNFVSFLDELLNVRLLEDLDAFRFTFGDLLELVHQSDSDSHSGELSSSTVSSFERVTSETRDLREIEVEATNEPLDSRGRVSSENFDQVVASEFPSLKKTKRKKISAFEVNQES